MILRTFEMILGKHMRLNYISLRQSTSEDEPFLLALRRVTMDEHLRRVGEPTDDAVHLARIRYRASDVQIVLWASVPIGLLKYFEGPREWVIVQVQILPAYQGQGISKQLLTECLARADLAEVAVSLTVLKGNKAINLYRRLGFNIVMDSGNSFKMKRERQTFRTGDVSADIRTGSETGAPNRAE